MEQRISGWFRSNLASMEYQGWVPILFNGMVICVDGNYKLNDSHLGCVTLSMHTANAALHLCYNLI